MNRFKGKSAEQIVSEMTLHEKICQMIVVNRADAVEWDDEEGERYRFDEMPYGGIIYYGADIVAARNVPLMMSNDQVASEIPLFSVIDEEGGIVSKLAGELGTNRKLVDGSNEVTLPFEGCTPLKPMYEYRNDGTQVAYDNAHTIGSYLVDYGFNWNLAPVADVAEQGNNDTRIIGSRCYSDDYEQAAELVAAAVEGFQDAGVMACLKHFPGHGEAIGDSHNGEVPLYKTMEELEGSVFLPFVSGIEAGVDSIMLGHIIVPDVDSAPATRSRKWIEYIRNDMGFNGLIVTDAMIQSDRRTSGSFDELSVLIEGINAGVDVLLAPEDPAILIPYIEKAVKRGDIPEYIIDNAVTRILNMKINKQII